MRYILDDAIYKHDDVEQSEGALQVVLTRFNMVLPGFREKGGYMDQSSFTAWLEQRITIFESVCLQSLRSQAKLPDAWLLGFDATLPDRVDPVLKLIEPYPWIRPVWQEAVDGQHESARLPFLREIKLMLRPEHRHVISTRVDNDDALAKGFLLGVHQYSNSVLKHHADMEDFWVVYPLGAQISGTAMRLLPQNNNAFLSRCERVSRYSGNRGGMALHFNHGRVFSQPNVYLPITRRPMWLQYVHSGNVSNKENEQLSRLADVAAELSNFGLRPEIFEAF